MSQVDEILAFWFGQPNTAEYGKQHAFWFTKSAEFDREVRERFLSDYEQAAAHQLDTWKEAPRSCLALILLLDQIPRNIFRGTPQAFATDAAALTAAQHAVAQGFDRELLNVQRWFIYLPFEHSENLEHQRQCVELFASLKDDPESASAIDYAQRHLAVIERFGRFPHRNKILNRESTPEELEFLQQPGSSF
ncbi:DUF924 family protein [Chroogloeocystis siderophila]|jgi:uncharacterized protein (DUF924 family)|uniref:DUF924 domain-containing protein n=1 Tax=Chroogloeocystis siderophila 5.2 s.c.1 TaxID=247279 RepID=A0A1U7HKE6_9CHRO|nr:DUF924 family protein [Chroogloeocystis siderophila]OKH24008.1 hypothetical protein NIES1031_17135 [Chroogloeocystis siderophila 5.2 s.c.1]